MKYYQIMPVVLAFFFSLTACSTYTIGLLGSEELKNNSIQMDVSGYDGRTTNKVVEFGPYKTDPFHITKPDLFTFVIRDQNNQPLTVTCTTDRQSIEENLQVSTGSGEKNVHLFSGTKKIFNILVQKGSQKVNTYYFEAEHTYFDLDGLSVRIVPYRYYDRSNKVMFKGVHFIDIHKDQSVAAIELSQKSIWIDERLNSSDKLALAALSASLALMQ